MVPGRFPNHNNLNRAITVNIAANELMRTLYSEAEYWLKQGVEITKSRFGEEHNDVATSLNNLMVRTFLNPRSLSQSTVACSRSACCLARRAII
jgi:hypothetical protein